MEYKTFDFEIKEWKDDDEKYFTFSGYASTFGNVDLGNDVVVEGAFTKSLKEIEESNKKIPVLWQHNTREPIGVFVEMREDSKGLFVRAILPKDDDFVKGRIMPQMKIGSISKLSIGYSTIDDDTKDGKRYLKELKVHEASIVTFPMNEDADIVHIKSLEDINSLKEIETYLKERDISNKNAKTLISKIKEIGFKQHRDDVAENARDVEIQTEVNELGRMMKEFKQIIGEK